ncbi:MAG: HEAT repeat domain-containing protein [Spirochaetaceae bacterium]|jgi:HEAT repeat protein|nr:HEAT repeat domain-containing protein [Spirochaetaceae bacterium]
MKKKTLLCLGALCFIFSLSADEIRPSIEEQRRDILKYGTENEIAELIRILRAENSDALDGEIVETARSIKNGRILSGIFGFFADREKGGLEERAREVLEYWDEQVPDAVRSALEYLGQMRDTGSVDRVMTLIDEGDARYTNSAVRALGRVGSLLKDQDRNESDAITDYLIAYFEDKFPGEDTAREIITALGSLENARAVAFLNGIAGNADERPARRMAAIQALSKIGDREGLDAVLEALQSSDPNLRSTAVAALGPFSGREVDQAILEAFRDTYYRTRIGAAQAAAQRKMEEAIPYLRYRAERDEVAAVKDEAIKALGAMDRNEAYQIVASLFFERRNSDRVRVVAGEILIVNRAGEYAEPFIAELDEARAKNQTALYNQFCRIIAQAETDKVEPLALRFFSSGGVVEKAYAIDMVYRNNLTGLIDHVKALTDERNGSLSRKARDTLQRMGVSYDA